MLLKLTVFAILFTIACFIVTLSRYHSVQASLPAVVRHVSMLIEGGFFLETRFAEARLHFIIFRDLSFSVQIYIFFDRGEVLQAISQIIESDLIILEHSDHLNNL